MSTRTVFILYEHPLFARGLEGLLRQERGLEVVGVAATGEEALVQIKGHKPDAVLVEADRGGIDPGMLLSRLIQDRGEGKVVGLSLTRKQAVLYTGRRFTANQAKDLITAIVGSGGS